MPHTVLVVEDDPGYRLFLRAVLSDAGMVVHEAPDPTQVEELVERLRPDVVLLDWILPGRSGLDVCRALTQSGYPGTVAIHTGLDDTRDRSAARAAGAAAFLPKDIPTDMLEQAVRGLMPKTAPLRAVDPPPGLAPGANVTAL